MGDQAASVSSASPEQLQARITDLEASVRTLQNRLSGYDRIFFQNSVPAIIYDASTLQILEANDGALELYEYDRAQIRSLAVLDLLGSASLQNLTRIRSELGRQMNVVGPLVHHAAGGRELTIRMVILAVDVRSGDARIAMLQDETARHIAEEGLRASEERYRDLFENANDVIFLHDLQGKVVAVNRAAEYLTGYSRAEILGADFAILLAPEARDAMQDSVRAHLGGSPTQHYELPIVSKFGTRRFLEVSTRIIYRRGQPVAIQGIGRDVTERKQSQQRLIESACELQLKNDELSTALQLAREATQLKEQFLANTSHELRTPMNGIMGMTDLLKDTDLSPVQREYVSAVSQCADDLLTIINDLLDVSQIGAGRLSLSEEPFDVRESLRAVITMLRPKANSKDLALTYEIESCLPATIFGDSVRLRQILINLIANAIKFTPSGGVQVRATVSGEGEKLFCTVVDSGIGVEEGLSERIFEAFFQADGTLRRRFGGTGLGLTISKQLVEIMGGRIGTFNNSPGPGATFWFELPLRTDEVAARDRLTS